MSICVLFVRGDVFCVSVDKRDDFGRTFHDCLYIVFCLFPMQFVRFACCILAEACFRTSSDLYMLLHTICKHTFIYVISMDQHHPTHFGWFSDGLLHSQGRMVLGLFACPITREREREREDRIEGNVPWTLASSMTLSKQVRYDELCQCLMSTRCVEQEIPRLDFHCCWQPQNEAKLLERRTTRVGGVGFEGLPKNPNSKRVQRN